ncbi:MAG: hypothetical protein GEU73_08785 [Chloroflexi bacterium]|nr:hypothetical protein [Chloroflexota bacterium]
MAGVGFRLRQLIARDSFTHGAAGYISAAIIAAGPWLTAVIVLSLLSSATSAFITDDERMLLFATITYVFSSSLILTGGPQMVVTRYIADRLYLNETGVVAPTYAAVIAVGTVVFSLATVPFVLLAPITLSFKLLAGSVFLTISLTWLALAFLSAFKDYMSIVLTYLVGYALSLGAAVWLGIHYEVTGSLAGFAFGQVVALVLLSVRVYAEFPSSDDLNLRVFGYFRRFWDLALLGLLYNVGVWADKIIYWFAAGGAPVAGTFRTFSPYDHSIWAAYLLTIPAYGVFIANIETGFYQHYREFFALIRSRGTLQRISEAQGAMIRAARDGLVTLLKVQGTIALFALLIADELASFLGLLPQYVPVLRIAIIAASVQVVLLAAILLLLYLDARRLALLAVLCLALANIGLTYGGLAIAPTWFGAGYLIAATLAALVAAYAARDVLRNFAYVTFMLQPIGDGRE